mgnify:CR=1 FL=1
MNGMQVIRLGNNIGIKRALEDGCEEVLISNSDVRYETGSISELQTYLQDHPDVGIVGPKIFCVMEVYRKNV